jgi:hypothetical protein
MGNSMATRRINPPKAPLPMFDLEPPEAIPRTAGELLHDVVTTLGNPDKIVNATYKHDGAWYDISIRRRG